MNDPNFSSVIAELHQGWKGKARKGPFGIALRSFGFCIGPADFGMTARPGAQEKMLPVFTKTIFVIY